MGSLSRPSAGTSSVTELTVVDGASIDGTTLVVDDDNDRVGIGLAAPKTKLTVEGTITLKEQADADADTAAYGQIWVNTATPNELYFTTDAGDDIALTSGTSMAGGISFANDANNRVVTGDGSGGINGEANLSFDGSTLAVTGALTTTTTASITGALSVGQYIQHLADTHTRLNFTPDALYFEIGGIVMMQLVEAAQDEVCFNENGSDIDFRVESLDDSHMLFIEGSSNKMSVGVSVDAPAALLEVTGDATTGAALMQLNNVDTDQICMDINAANIDANIIDIVETSLTTGSALAISSNSASTGVRTLVQIIQDHADAVNATPLLIKNDAIAAKGTVVIESTAAETNPLIELINSHNSADKPPMLRFNKVVHVADDMEIGKLSFFAGNDADPVEPVEYATIVAYSSDVSDGSEGGELRCHVMDDGTLTEVYAVGREDGGNTFCFDLNRGQNDIDFMVRGDNVAALFRTTASSDAVGIGAENTEATALLKMTSTTKGFMPPVMTTTQQNAISSPATGLVLYNSSTNKLMVYNGSAWTALH